MFANCPGEWGLIPGQVIPKTQNMVLDASLLNTQHYKIWVKGKWSNPGKGVVPPIHLSVVAIKKVTFDYGRPTYLYTVMKVL